MPYFASAQTVTEIEILRSGDYHWGKGYGENREESLINAKSDLIEKMVITIVSKTTRNVEENIEGYEGDYSSEFKMNQSTFSRIKLRDLEYLPPVKRRNGTWEAVAYVSKDNFENAMLDERDKLYSLLTQAIRNERIGNLNLAIPQYFNIYATTFFYPAYFYTDKELHGIETELRSFVSNKILNWLSNTKIEVKGIRSLSISSNTEIYVDLKITYNKFKTDNFNISFAKLGYAEYPVINGEASIYLDVAPEKPVKVYSLLLEPIIPARIDEEKRDLINRLLSERKISLAIDFSQVMNVDFTVEKVNKNSFRFIPRIKNISVFDLDWEFGGGENSNEISPVHNYKNIDKAMDVTLVVNQEDVLSVTKSILGQGIPEPAAISNFVLEDHENYINEAIRIKNGSTLVNYLNSIAKKGIIELGNKSDVSKPENSYIAIIEPDSRNVVAVLTSVKKGKRYNLNTKTWIKNSEISDIYKGLGSIWFQFK